MLVYFIVALLLGMYVWSNLPQDSKESRVQPWMTIISMLLWPSTLLVVIYIDVKYGRDKVEGDDYELGRKIMLDVGAALAFTAGLGFTFIFLR